MNPERNPFAPGAGTPPPELAGRSGLLSEVAVALARVSAGRPAQGTILVGLRGVGKTVLLVRMNALAHERRLKTLQIEIREGTRLPDVIVPGLRSILHQLSTSETARDLVRRGFRVMRSFVSSIRISIDDFEFGLSVDPERGTADSGNLDLDLPDLFEAIGEAARAAGTAIVLVIDELQYLDGRDFGALIMSLHKTTQQGLPVHLVGAGLPQILALAGHSKSYAERLFRYPSVGPLQGDDARAAVRNPIDSEGAAIDDDALNEIIAITEGYPYFIQQWSHEAWNIAPGPSITLADVRAANEYALRELDQSFFRVRFDRCTPAEKRYLRALADLGPGSHRSGEIAERLGAKVTAVGPLRNKLIAKGMIYSPQHGDTAFTVPMFDRFMIRAMPILE